MINNQDTAQNYSYPFQQGSTIGKREFLRLFKRTFARWIFRAQLQLITESWQLGLTGNYPSHFVPKISLRKHDFPAIHRKVIHREDLLFQTFKLSSFFHCYSLFLRWSNQLFHLEWNLLPLFSFLNIYSYKYIYIYTYVLYTTLFCLHWEVQKKQADREWKKKKETKNKTKSDLK